MFFRNGKFHGTILPGIESFASVERTQSIYCDQDAGFIQHWAKSGGRRLTGSTVGDLFRDSEVPPDFFTDAWMLEQGSRTGYVRDPCFLLIVGDP